MLGQIIKNGGVFALSFATFIDTVDRMFFTPNFGTYEKLTFFNDPTYFKLIIIGLYIGIVIASFCSYYNRHVLGLLVRKLDSEDVRAEETAKTLDELGFGKHILIKFALLTSAALRRVVAFSPSDPTRVGGLIAYASLNKERYRMKEDRIYLPDGKRDSAVTRFRPNGSGLLSLAFTVIVGLVVVVAIMKLAPYAVNIVENMLVGFDPDANVLN